MITSAERDALLAMLGPDQRLALAYARKVECDATLTLFAFDKVLGAAVSQATEPIAGQLRLAWWRDLIDSEEERGSRDPLANAVGRLAVKPHSRAALTAMVNGWESLLRPFPLSDQALAEYAAGRGGGLFAAIAGVRLPPDAGWRWALADFAFHCSDHGTAQRAITIATGSQSANGLPRPLAILDRFATSDTRRGLAKGSAQGTIARLLDALAAGLFGS